MFSHLWIENGWIANTVWSCSRTIADSIRVEVCKRTSTNGTSNQTWAHNEEILQTMLECAYRHLNSRHLNPQTPRCSRPHLQNLWGSCCHHHDLWLALLKTILLPEQMDIDWSYGWYWCGSIEGIHHIKEGLKVRWRYTRKYVPDWYISY